MTEPRMVHIKRTGPGVADWSLAFDDGTPLPPVSALSIGITAGHAPSLNLDVVDVDFDGVLPATWRMSYKTLAAMAADQGLELAPQGVVARKSAVIADLMKGVDELIRATRTNAGALTQSREETTAGDREIVRLKRKIEEYREASALNKDRIAEFRENNIRIAKLADARYEIIQSLIADKNALQALVAVTVSDRWDLVNTISRERRCIELLHHTQRNNALHAERFTPPPADIDDELAALRLEVGASRLIVAEAEEARLRCAKYEQENHLLKRRISLGEPAVGAAQVEHLETERHPPILAVPTSHMRDVVQKQIGDAVKVVCFEQSLMGLRTDLVIVSAPLPEQAASARFWEKFEGNIIPQLRCRLTPGGKLVRL